MRAELIESSQHISVERGFFRLLDMYDSGSLVRLSYEIDQTSALRLGASTVRVTVYVEREPAPTVTRGVSVDSPQSLIDNILTHHASLKASVKQNDEYVLARYNSDFTKSVDNSTIRSLVDERGGSVRRQIRAVPTIAATSPIHVNNSLVAIETTNRTSRGLALRLITDRGIDPSEVAAIGRQVSRASDAANGTFTSLRSTDERLLEYMKTVLAAEVPGDMPIAMSYELQTTSTSRVEVFDEVILPIRLDSIGELFVSFQLVNNKGEIATTVVKKVKTDREVSIFRTPKRAPVVRSTKTQMPGQGTIDVRQVDPVAKYVAVFKRNVGNVVPIESEGYKLVGRFPLTVNDGMKSVPVEIDAAVPTIIRVIPVGEYETVGSEFSSVVIRPDQGINKLVSGDHTVSSRRFSHASMTSRITQTGVTLDIRKIPFDVAMIRIIRRDISAGDGVLKTIGVLSTVQDRDVYTVIDDTVIPHSTYEYYCDLVFADGESVRATNEIVEFRPLTSDLIVTNITDVNVFTNNSDFDVRFNVSAHIVPTTLDTVKNALEKQGLSDLFSDELLKERDALTGLITYHVSRVNLTTGERETFGVLPSTSFSDAELRAVNAVQPLRKNSAYRYEVMTLMRQPETMFSEFTKVAIDKHSNREYSFRPYKYRHPIVRKHGNIGDPSSIRAHYASDEFSFGYTGSIAMLDIDLSADSTRISYARASRIGSSTVEVMWKIVGDIETIDHFLIAKNGIGGREIIGRSHTQQDGAEFYFYHTLEDDEIGDVSYIVIPIMSDFSKGAEIVTNRVSIDSVAPTRVRATRVNHDVNGTLKHEFTKLLERETLTRAATRS